MHFWLGLGVRAGVEGGYRIAKKVREKRENPKKLNSTDYLLHYFRNNHGREIIGTTLPILENLMEYLPNYKESKDALVSQFTHSPSIPPNVPDQLNDMGWFMLGYFSPEVVGVYKEGLKHTKKSLEKMLRKK